MKRTRIWEFLVLFVALPVGFLISPADLPKLPCLLGLAAVCTGILLRDPGFDRGRLRRPAPWRFVAATLLGRSAAILVGLAAGILLFKPQLLFIFPKSKPSLWLLVMGLYPFLSALPQELIYRVFFFHRYRSLFTTDTAMIWASTLSFAYMHLLFGNLVAPLLSIPAGYLFAHTYARTCSLPAVALEHALYGNIVFTVGLGMYFYRGV